MVFFEKLKNILFFIFFIFNRYQNVAENKINAKKKNNHRGGKPKVGATHVTAPKQYDKDSADERNISRTHKPRPDNRDKKDSAPSRQINHDIPAIG